ncbi:ATP-binding protein [Thermoflavimicrobium dichotomicum]|nr:ATP-binding protein [Thermoflavimicrobium dichotomicum]
MQTMSPLMAEIKKRIQILKQKQKSAMATMTNSLDSSQTKYKCDKCKDTGYIIKSWEGGGLAAECSCLEMKRLMRRFKSAMIPDEFKQATFQDYKIRCEAHEILLNAAKKYVEEFDQIKGTSANSLGFIAIFGEQRMKEMPKDQRAIMKRKHNNYGLGKTHLQVAIAKELLRKGEQVLIVADVALMDELMNLRRSDNQQTFNERIHQLITVPVLVWDDIGKANPTEAKQSMYFQIINERYRAQRPIIYSSNEDAETLSDRIGPAATSRLLGMSKGRIYRVEGPDYRLTGEAE